MNKLKEGRDRLTERTDGSSYKQPEPIKMNEETHHKMSKKIAQLTKVIFHLHSKNEENVTMQTAVQNAYEKEIETLLNSANGVITKQKDALTRAQEGEAWKQKIKALENEHLEDKRESQTQFQEYKKRLQGKE